MFFYYIGIKLETKQKDIWKSPNIKKLNNILLNNLWVKEKNAKGIIIYLELVESKNSICQSYQIMQKIAKSMFRKKCVTLNAYFRKAI